MSTNPSEWFGGVWEAFATGRTLVGIDTSQSEFNTSLKTGGSKYLQSHMHWVIGSGYSTHVTIGDSTWGWNSGVIPKTANSAGSHVMADYAGSGDSGNLQPYIVVYMWKRIS